VHLAFTTFKSTSDMKSHLKEAFKVFDKNHDGLINRLELKEVVTCVIKGNEALAVSEDEIDSMLAAADIDRDGHINYEGKHETIIIFVINLSCTEQYIT